jgi:NAD-dependent dihydropyrimidine dehydrogenase PreA subunit
MQVSATIPCKPNQPTVTTRRWALGTVLIVTIAFGWAFPFIGFTVPLVMMTAIAVSMRRGRQACGHLCPRGSFFDSWFQPFAGGREVPAALRKPVVRWSIFAGLMGFMALQLSRNPTDLAHWGLVFWLACTLTSVIGIALGVRYQARAWCTVCPIGTLTARIGAGKYQLRIAESCKACGQCERSCPMELSIAAHRASGELPHADCIKCSTCSSNCPQQALSWPKAA